MQDHEIITAIYNIAPVVNFDFGCEKYIPPKVQELIEFIHLNARLIAPNLGAVVITSPLMASILAAAIMYGPACTFKCELTTDISNNHVCNLIQLSDPYTVYPVYSSTNPDLDTIILICAIDIDAFSSDTCRSIDVNLQQMWDWLIPDEKTDK